MNIICCICFVLAAAGSSLLIFGGGIPGNTGGREGKKKRNLRQRSLEAISGGGAFESRGVKGPGGFMTYVRKRFDETVRYLSTESARTPEGSGDIRNGDENGNTGRRGRKKGLSLRGTRIPRYAVMSCLAALAGAVACLVTGKIILALPVSALCASVPIAIAFRRASRYEKKMREETEVAMSVISTSYIRSDDLLLAVRENLIYLKRPVKDVFREFVLDLSVVSADVRGAILKMKNRTSDPVFREWCDTLVRCQDDRSLKDTLLPVVSKMTDMRIINNDMKTILDGARNEYLAMAGLLLFNIPLIYLLNWDWFRTLTGTTAGEITLGVILAVLVVTYGLMTVFTRPIEYKR